MHPVDILLSSILVILASLILAFSLALSVIAVKNRRAATKLEINAAMLVCQGVVSGQWQLICLSLSVLLGAVFYSQGLTLTAIATVYCGVVYMILSTCFWVTARHVAQYVYTPRASTYEPT